MLVLSNYEAYTLIIQQVSELQRQFAPTHGTPQAVWIERALDFMEQKNYEDVVNSVLMC